MKKSVSISKLPNGLKLITSENQSSPVVTLRLVVNAGSAYELKNEYGYAHVLEHMLLKGTKRRPTSYDIGLEIDRIGAYSNAATSHNAAWFILQAASQHSEKLFDVMSDNILNSIIDTDVLENEKRVIIGEFRQRNNMLVRKSLIGALTQYTNEHPIARDPLGVEDIVLKATPEALYAYKTKYYVPNNCILIVTGAIKSEQVYKFAKKYFGSWDGSVCPDLKLPEIKFDYGKSGFVEHPTDITYLTICYGIGRSVSFEEYAALALISSRLGYGYTSLIQNELRNKRGLTYNSSVNVRYHSVGTVVTIGTSSERPDEVRSIIHDIIKNLEYYLTDVEIEEMKQQVIGVFERKMSESDFEISFLQDMFVQFGEVVTPEKYLLTIRDLKPESVRATSDLFFDTAHEFCFALGKKPLV